jgi:hypothetical protein
LSSSAFRIAFEGAPFADGEIDVKDIAPALLALGDVVQSANRALNGDRAHARLKLKASREGSFEALLNIDISMIDAIRDMLHAVADERELITAADQLMELLLKGGTILAAPIAGLIAAVRFLNGRRPDKIETRDDGTTRITVNETTIIVKNQTMRLLEDVATRAALEQFSERSLGVPGVSAIRIGAAGSSDAVVLTSADRNSFRLPEPIDEAPIVEASEREVWLRIITSHFRDGYKWRFTDGGEKPFTADMADAEFIKRVQEGKVTLSANDTLRCRVREEQRLSQAGLTKEQQVVEVLEHIQAARQLRLL